MEGSNESVPAEFLLLGFSEDAEEQQLLFVAFLSMYLVTELGNLLIILAITTDPRLHSPMYFFLANLASVDICFTSTTIPKMLANHVSGRRGIPYAGCLTQVFFFIWLAGTDSFLLAAMAYDRYAAICHPLRYAASVTPRLCGLLVAASWAAAFGNGLTHTVLLTRLSFCARNRVPHFFCDLSPLLKLACSDTWLNHAMVDTVGALPILAPFAGILGSYTRIFAAVLRIPSAGGRRKAFSTCGSHLSVVSLFYGTLIGVYFSPMSSHTAQRDAAAAVMYTVVTPMLNPFIYSLRNRDMKAALGALLGRKPDFNGDDYICAADLAQTVRRLTRGELSAEEERLVCEKVLDEADGDQDGRLSLEDFQSMLLRAPDFLRSRRSGVREPYGGPHATARGATSGGEPGMA
ncbi:olfactory receptor 1f45-like [Dasypus novemcinctus]|uniref:olfactory receptor 1f45-like n=1 Tax=Dasypus novemcinctus TaxID=9361 RepID=UPI00265E3390|nr:olfactory receptor 1361-like [Dasypus novemcinctus]